MNKTRFPHIFPLPLALLLNRIQGSCQLNYWFNNQVESISRFSNPTHDEDIALGNVDLVEAEIVSQSQPLSDDGDSTGASTNLSLLQINEMVEKAVPKRKGGRLVGLARDHLLYT
ncbi:hypothetical protein F2Q70_00038409 [Brassica cretica]|uniref:Uncharacterized protein n=1 Tax=Brassica cretica TaxID=69181 RepID=A0A8S9K922_BRACR|nr:hypothetical protein F2Q70_00038409 [Brassica cretica]